MAEELNRKYHLVESPDGWKQIKKRRKYFIVFSSFIIVSIFIISIVGRSLQVFTWPSLDFLADSQQLVKDPEIQNLRLAVVEIDVKRREGAMVLPQQRGGSGFNIRPDGLIVTNRHVVENADSIIITFPGEGIYAADEVIISEEADLALVYIEGESLPFVNLSEEGELPPGENVTIIGNPLGYRQVVVTGTVEAYQRRTDIKVMEIEAPVHPGSSGSPVFNDKGNVVGVIYATRVNNEDDVLGMAVSLTELLKLLDVN